MQAQTTSRAIAAGAVIVAAGIVLLARRPSDAPLPTVQPPDISLAVANEPRRRVVEEPPAAVDAALVEAKVRELEALSETFRNSTFLIAIRDAGYVCNNLLRVYGGFDDSGKWTATCSEMLSYTVSVAGNGTLHVEPMWLYFDGTGPATLPSDQGPGQPRLLFPPQELPPQPSPQR